MSQLSPSPLDRILELKDEAEEQKVELTPEVKAYIQSHLEIVQAKLSKGEDVTEDDMKFIDEVRLWVSIPEEWKRKYPSVEAMKNEPRIMESPRESKNRNITIQQWCDILHLAESSGNSESWIIEKFQFPGKGKITVRNLDLSGSSLTHLPENLKVRENLDLRNCRFLNCLPDNLNVTSSLRLDGCISLKRLPDSLKVGLSLDLFGCTSLIYLPSGMELSELILNDCTSLTKLPEKLRVGNLGLAGCSSLTYLPENLTVRLSLNIRDCTSLANLPKTLVVQKDLLLSQGLQPKVKKDAENLKREGNIEGEIKYF